MQTDLHQGLRPASATKGATDEQIRDQREAQRLTAPFWPFAATDPITARHVAQQAARLPGRRW